MDGNILSLTDFLESTDMSHTKFNTSSSIYTGACNPEQEHAFNCPNAPPCHAQSIDADVRIGRKQCSWNTYTS